MFDRTGIHGKIIAEGRPVLHQKGCRDDEGVVIHVKCVLKLANSLQIS